MPFADPVMDAGQPCLEICEDEMDDGQKLVGHFGITTFGNGVVIVTAPVVRDDQRPRSERAIDKSAKRFGASVSGDRQPHAPRIAPIVSLVPRGSRLAMAHLDGAGDQSFVVHASAFAACAAADPGFVHFDVFVRATPDAILVRADHSGAKLMEDLEGCLIARQPELPLKLDGRHALSLAGDQVGSPEPSGQWRVTALHDRADSQSCLTSTVAACQHTRAGRDAKRLTSDATMRTDEAVPPAHLFEVFGAGGIAREEPLKLRQRPRKRQPRVLVDVHENQRRRIHTCSPLSGNRFQGIAPIASGFRPYSQTNTTPGGCMRQPDKHGLTKVEPSSPRDVPSAIRNSTGSYRVPLEIRLSTDLIMP